MSTTSPPTVTNIMVEALPSSTSNKKPVKKVAIVGSTGKLGQCAIQQLIQRQIPMKCLIRQSSPPEFLLQQQTKYPNLIEFVTNGDVTNLQKVTELLDGCTHCLALHGATRKTKLGELLFAAESSEDIDKSHAKQVNYLSIQNFIDASQSTSCEHIVRITGKGEQPNSFFSILINGLGSMAKGWNYEGEQLLRSQSKSKQEANKKKNKILDYTIIRPGIMKTDYDPVSENVHLELVDNGGELPVSSVSYDQIAELCIESLFHPQYARGTTLTAMNVKNDNEKEAGDGGNHPEWTIAKRLQNVKKDTRQFPKSLIQQHKDAVKKTFRSVAAIFAGIMAIMAGIVLKFLVR